MASNYRAQLRLISASGRNVAALLLAMSAGLGCMGASSAPTRVVGCESSREDAANVRAHTDVGAARELDREGVQSFREGRYEDASRYFRSAYRMGGPSSELWNIARAREKVDDFEGADAAIREYLEQPDLSPQDRSEADREARALRARPSVLTVTTTPAGAAIVLDGRQTTGPTPISIEVAPGSHSIVIRREGYAVQTKAFEARFGRAVIVSLDLTRAGN